MPVFPDLDWFLSILVESILALVIFLSVNFEHTTKLNRFTRKELKKMNPYKLMPSIIFLIVTIVFIVGLLPYKPVAVMSNSMVPEFSRGDIVVIKKLSKEDIQALKKNDIIEYNLNGDKIIHRIVKIQSNNMGKLTIITKGDNNRDEDFKTVTAEQIIGLVKFKIPLLGYPSVLFSEILFSKKSYVNI